MLELNIAIICGSVPAFASFLKHTKRLTSKRYTSISLRPSRPLYSNTRTLTSRKGELELTQRENPFIESRLLENNIRAGSTTLESILAGRPIPEGAIMQSFEVEVSSSVRSHQPDEINSIHERDHERELGPPQYPKALLRSESKA